MRLGSGQPWIHDGKMSASRPHTQPIEPGEQEKHSRATLNGMTSVNHWSNGGKMGQGQTGADPDSAPSLNINEPPLPSNIPEILCQRCYFVHLSNGTIHHDSLVHLYTPSLKLLNHPQWCDLSLKQDIYLQSNSYN